MNCLRRFAERLIRQPALPDGHARLRSPSFFVGYRRSKNYPKGASSNVDGVVGKADLDLGERDVALLIQQCYDLLGMDVGARLEPITTRLSSHCAPMLAASWCQQIALTRSPRIAPQPRRKPWKSLSMQSL